MRAVGVAAATAACAWSRRPKCGPICDANQPRTSASPASARVWRDGTHPSDLNASRAAVCGGRLNIRPWLSRGSLGTRGLDSRIANTYYIFTVWSDQGTLETALPMAFSSDRPPKPSREASAASRQTEPDHQPTIHALASRPKTALDADDRPRPDTFRDDLLALLPDLRHFAQSLARETSQAEDLVQETLLEAWQDQDRYRPGFTLKAWTFAIMRNQFHAELRKTHRTIMTGTEPKPASPPRSIP